MSTSSIKALLKEHLCDSSFDEVNLLNLSRLYEAPVESKEIVTAFLKSHRENHQHNRNDLALSITVEKIQQLAPSLEHLDQRLQKHMQMLRQNECSLSGTNTVLEYDSAKSKADKLVEILKAKKVWSNVFEELRLLEPTDCDLRYQKLLELQKSFDILHKYAPKNSERENNFERMKDEFLSWFSSAAVLAIDSNDAKQVEALRGKYVALDRITVFEQIFGSYAKNKIKCFLDHTVNERTIWKVLQEMFSIWKQCNNLCKTIMISDRGSNMIAENLLDGLTQKWDVIASLVTDAIASAETPFKAAREIGKVCNDFLSYVESEGDNSIYDASLSICRHIFTVLSDDYSKHVTSVLLCAINKITVPERSVRGHYDWLLTHIDEVHSCMRGIIDEARTTFGAEFPQQIVSSFEKGIKELNFLLMNQDVFNVKNRREESKRAVEESMEDKISAICVTGSILNLVDRVNAYIIVCISEYKTASDFVSPLQVGNKSVVERLNRKIVARKIESIVNGIIQTMNAEMIKLKLSVISRSAEDAMKISLPSFSIAPHNYITNVGHELLNVMNTISAYGTNKNFVSAVMSIAGKAYNEEEADLWVVTEIGTRVMEAFCDNIDNISHSDVQLMRQFHADIVFLMEALIDLRLQPTTRLVECAAKLKKATEEDDSKKN